MHFTSLPFVLHALPISSSLTHNTLIAYYFPKPTQRSKILEDPTVAHRVKTFTTFHEIQRFIAVSTIYTATGRYPEPAECISYPLLTFSSELTSHYQAGLSPFMYSDATLNTAVVNANVKKVHKEYYPFLAQDMVASLSISQHIFELY
jgi:hypothetical protein